MIADKDKPLPPPDPNDDQPATPTTPTGPQTGTTPAGDEEQAGGDYAIVSSGLGIDE